MAGKKAAKGISIGTGPMQPEIAALISFIIAGLGLYFVWPEAKKMTALVVTAVLFVLDAAIIIGSTILGFICVVPFLFLLLVPVIHVAAAAYTYMEAKKK